MNKWAKLREWLDTRLSKCSAAIGTVARHVLSEMDRLEREEATTDPDHDGLIRTLRMVADDHAKAASYGGAGREWQERACSAVRQAIEILGRETEAADAGNQQPAPACVDALCRPFCHDWSEAEGCLMAPSRLHYQDKEGTWDCDWLASAKPADADADAEKAHGEMKPSCQKCQDEGLVPCIDLYFGLCRAEGTGRPCPKEDGTADGDCMVPCPACKEQTP